MQNLSDSLSAYYKLRQQKATQLPAQISQLQQQLATQLQALQEMERRFLSAQEDVLEQIRPILAIAARSLLPTPQFKKFVRDLLMEVKAKRNNPAFILKVSPKPDKWILPTLQYPLQLSNIEMSEQTNSYGDKGEFLTIYGIRMAIHLGEWQQVFTIPTATAQNDNPDMYHAYSAFTQWYEAVVCMKPALEELPVVQSKQQRLAQELTCLIAYVCDLFNLYSIAERVGFLHQLKE